MWTVEQIMEIAAKNGRTLSKEQAAFNAYCFNEAERTGGSPVTIGMKIMEEIKARENLGKVNTDNAPKKETWQL